MNHVLVILHSYNTKNHLVFKYSILNFVISLFGCPGLLPCLSSPYACHWPNTNDFDSGYL